MCSFSDLSGVCSQVLHSRRQSSKDLDFLLGVQVQSTQSLTVNLSLVSAPSSEGPIEEGVLVFMLAF